MIASEHFNGGTSDAEDLSDISEWENGDTTIAMFVTYLRTKPNGVIMPRSLPKGPETKMLLGEKPVSMESIPALV